MPHSRGAKYRRTVDRGVHAGNKRCLHFSVTDIDATNSPDHEAQSYFGFSVMICEGKFLCEGEAGYISSMKSKFACPSRRCAEAIEMASKEVKSRQG